MRLQNLTTRALKVAIIATSMFLSSCEFSDTFYSNVLRSEVFHQLYDDTQYDFLWVFDNSDSMSDKRQFVVDNMQTFMNIMNSRKAVDFQMAVTTTDMMTQAGALVQSDSGLSVIRSTSANPVADFASIMENVGSSPTAFWEQGLESAYQAIYQHGSTFSRTGVPLIVIFVTDEDDYSCESHCFGIQPEDNPDDVVYSLDRYTEYFSNVKAFEDSELYVFPIVGMSSSTCALGSVGTRYEDLQKSLGNLSVSGGICNDELQDSFERIAQIVADRGTIFRLSKTASGRGMNLYVDGVLIPYSPENYRYDETENAIVFTGAVPKSGSTIEISYSQRLE